MFLVNMVVVYKIYCVFFEQVLLCWYFLFQIRMFNDLVEFCDQMGLFVDFSFVGVFNKSLI